MIYQRYCVFNLNESLILWATTKTDKKRYVTSQKRLEKLTVYAYAFQWYAIGRIKIQSSPERVAVPIWGKSEIKRGGGAHMKANSRTEYWERKPTNIHRQRLVQEENQLRNLLLLALEDVTEEEAALILALLVSLPA